MDLGRHETAYHEAGHFIASSLINQMPGIISIEPSGAVLGSVGRLGGHRQSAFDFVNMLSNGDPNRDDAKEAYILEYAIKNADTGAFICAAGGVAAQIYLDMTYPESKIFATGLEVDEWDAYEVYEYLDYYDDSYERYEEVKRYTKLIFTDPVVWRAIEYVAHHLLEHGSLDEYASGELTSEVSKQLEGKQAPPHFENLLRHFSLLDDSASPNQELPSMI